MKNKVVLRLKKTFLKSYRAVKAISSILVETYLYL
jgi:hypothetical protein